MLKYHIIILLQQFTKTFKQFFKLSSNLSRAKWAIEWIKGVVRYTFKFCFNKWKLSQKNKIACRLKTTLHEQITFSDCHYQCNSYSGNLFLNPHMLSSFAALEINKLAVVGKSLWRFGIVWLLWLNNLFFHFSFFQRRKMLHGRMLKPVNCFDLTTVQWRKITH